MTTTQQTKRRLRQPSLRMPQAQPKQTPTLERVHSDIRKAFGFQLNTFVAQFLEANTDEDIEAFLPQNIAEADRWIDELVAKFVDIESPSTDEMLDGIAAIFMMAFLERVYEHCGVDDDDEPDDEEVDEEVDEEDEQDDEVDDEEDDEVNQDDEQDDDQ